MLNDRIDVVGTNIAEKSSMIWNEADMLRGPFKLHEYRLVILPMTCYFYDYQAPEPVEDIMARIIRMEADISASLRELFLVKI